MLAFFLFFFLFFFLNLGSFSYTSCAVLIFMQEVSLTHPVLFFVCLFLIRRVPLTHPMLESIWPREFLLHISRWLDIYVGSLCYTSCCGFNFISWFSLTHLKTGFIFIGGVSLTHTVLASFLSGEFLLHIARWLHFFSMSFWHTSSADCFYVGSFSYTSHAGNNFTFGVSLTHTVLVWYWCREFLLHILCGL